MMQPLGRASVQQQPIFFRNGESGGELKETIFECKMGNGELRSTSNQCTRRVQHS